jgi:hypothetical protein
MSKYFYAVIAGVSLFSFAAFAEGPKVEDSQGVYVTKIVTAENVKGVEVRLSKEIVRNDCNQHAMRLTNVLVSGSGDGWHDRYFWDAWIMQTKMHCPLDEPVNETIYSEPMFIKSFANQYVNNKVLVTIVIPKGYKIEVVVVKESTSEN